ncbi:MAG TPA: hypothetical protein VHB68_20970 [Steroidobacteraceae bacterium]|nr:hypothetical protein [Steroidobacteraceae bacterium]
MKNNRSTRLAYARFLIASCGVLALGGCGGSSNNGGPTVPTYTLSATISGLGSSVLVLSVNGSSSTISGDATTVALAYGMASGTAYSVAVQTQPTGQVCSVANGTGTVASANVVNVAVTCSAVSYTVGGTISGLTATGLVLLDNGSDATSIAANATQFSMHTGLAYGSTYDVTVGTQPYGISLVCTPSNASSTVSADVTTVAISCATVAPTQTAIPVTFGSPGGVAVDAHGNVFLTDTVADAVEEIPYSNGSYGSPVTLGSGFFGRPFGITVDLNGNLFVTDTVNNIVAKIPYSNGSYGTPVIVGPTPLFNSPEGVAVDTSGNVFVADTGNNTVWEIPYSNGAYGTPVTMGAGFSAPGGVAVDANGNVFVADTLHAAVKEIPYTSGSYGTPQTVGSGFTNPQGLAVDANGNVFVADTSATVVEEIPYNNGTYGTTLLSVGSGLSVPSGVAVDSLGRLYAIDGHHLWSFVP